MYVKNTAYYVYLRSNLKIFSPNFQVSEIVKRDKILPIPKNKHTRSSTNA